jgi:C1A family cysteine protease
MSERKFIQLDPGAQRPRPGVYNQPAVYVPKGQKDSSDLRSFFGPIEDQLNLGACTAFAALQWYAAWQVKQGKPWIDYDELAQYFEERVYEGTVDQDCGAFMHDAVKVLENWGVMLERGYDPSKFRNKPDESKFIKGSDLPSNLVKQIDPNDMLYGVIDALSNGYPVLFGAIVFPEIQSAEVAQTGILPLPKQGEVSIGGHAMVAVCHSKTKRTVTARNQWGEKWGQGGYVEIPWEYFAQYAWECYVIEQDAPTPQPQPAIRELVIELYINSNKAYINGHEIILDQPPIIQNNTTLVPIRLVSEEDGFNVEWNQGLQKVTLRKQTP